MQQAQRGETRSRLHGEGLMRCRMFDDCWISAGPDLDWKLCQGRPRKRRANLSLCQRLEKSREEPAKVCLDPHKPEQQMIRAAGPVQTSACVLPNTIKTDSSALMGSDTSSNKITEVHLSWAHALSHQSELHWDGHYCYLCHMSGIHCLSP